jgi:hypothetical protein
MSKKVKTFAIIVLVLAVIIFIGSKFGGSAPNTSEGPLETTAGIPIVSEQVEPGGGNEFSALLSTVSSISIDTAIFSNPAYKVLRDNPITLGSEVVGRNNPFAPIGTDSGGGETNVPVVQTLQPGKVTSTTAEFSAQVSFSTTAPVSVIFQYGPTDQFGFVTAPVILNKSGTALITVRDLAPSTSYMVQAVAVVGSTTTNGNTMSFATTTPTQ